MDILEKMFSSFKETAKRIESLPVHRIKGKEWEEFTKYKSKESIIGFANQEWLNDLDKYKQENRKVSRIRIIPKIITPYLVYETEWCYPRNISHGEDIRFVKQKEYKDIVSKNEDFWIFDDKYVVCLIYSKEGSFVEDKLIDDPGKVKEYLDIYNNLNKLSKSFNELSKLVQNS